MQNAIGTAEMRRTPSSLADQSFNFPTPFLLALRSGCFDTILRRLRGQLRLGLAPSQSRSTVTESATCLSPKTNSRSPQMAIRVSDSEHIPCGFDAFAPQKAVGVIPREKALPARDVRELLLNSHAVIYNAQCLAMTFSLEACLSRQT